MGKKRAADEAADARQHTKHTQKQPSARRKLQQGSAQEPKGGLARVVQGFEDGLAAKPAAIRAATEPEEAGTSTPTAPQPVMKEKRYCKQDEGKTDIRHGRFSEEEVQKLTQAVHDYAVAHSLSTTDFRWLFQLSKHNQVGALTEIGKCLPNRLYGAVQNQLSRLFRPITRKGRWTPEEDKQLLELHATLGSRWVLIGEKLGRHPKAVQSRHSEMTTVANPNKGRWTADETMRIVEAVKEYVAKRDSFLLGGSAMQEELIEQEATPEDRVLLSNGTEQKLRRVRRPSGPKTRRDAVIGDGINWAWVSKKMGTRTPIQCENKWYKTIAPSRVDDQGRAVLSALNEGPWVTEDEVPWATLVWDLPEHEAKRHWVVMARGLPRRQEMNFREKVDILVKRHLTSTTGAGDAKDTAGKQQGTVSKAGKQAASAGATATLSTAAKRKSEDRGAQKQQAKLDVPAVGPNKKRKVQAAGSPGASPGTFAGTGWEERDERMRAMLEAEMEMMEEAGRAESDSESEGSSSDDDDDNDTSAGDSSSSDEGGGQRASAILAATAATTTRGHASKRGSRAGGADPGGVTEKHRGQGTLPGVDHKGAGAGTATAALGSQPAGGLAGTNHTTSTSTSSSSLDSGNSSSSSSSSGHSSGDSGSTTTSSSSSGSATSSSSNDTNTSSSTTSSSSSSDSSSDDDSSTSSDDSSGDNKASVRDTATGKGRAQPAGHARTGCIPASAGGTQLHREPKPAQQQQQRQAAAPAAKEAKQKVGQGAALPLSQAPAAAANLANKQRSGVAPAVGRSAARHGTPVLAPQPRKQVPSSSESSSSSSDTSSSSRSSSSSSDGSSSDTSGSSDTSSSSSSSSEESSTSSSDDSSGSGEEGRRHAAVETGTRAAPNHPATKPAAVKTGGGLTLASAQEHVTQQKPRGTGAAAGGRISTAKAAAASSRQQGPKEAAPAPSSSSSDQDSGTASSSSSSSSDSSSSAATSGGDTSSRGSSEDRRCRQGGKGGGGGMRGASRHAPTHAAAGREAAPVGKRPHACSKSLPSSKGSSSSSEDTSSDDSSSEES